MSTPRPEEISDLRRDLGYYKLQHETLKSKLAEANASLRSEQIVRNNLEKRVREQHAHVHAALNAFAALETAIAEAETLTQVTSACAAIRELIKDLEA